MNLLSIPYTVVHVINPGVLNVMLNVLLNLVLNLAHVSLAFYTTRRANGNHFGAKARIFENSTYTSHTYSKNKTKIATNSINKQHKSNELDLLIYSKIDSYIIKEMVNFQIKVPK